MAKKRKITKKEVNNRIGYVFLGFFGFLLVEPIRNLFNTNFQIEPITQMFIAIIGILFVLFMGDF